jgi:hypothetical protein
MSTYIDKKFINIISSKLEKFAWKKETLANCRCPICGDSQKHKNKARGFFFQKGNDFFFKCHNCSFSSNLYNFLEQVAPALCKEYAIERWKNGENGKSNYKKPKIEFEKPKFKKTELEHCIPLSDLDINHPCKRYVLSRKIPHEALNLLYYTDNFAAVANAIDPEKDGLVKESRLVIPIYDEDGTLVGAQGRYIGVSKKAIRYITIKKQNTSRLWYGLNRVRDEPVYVLEGPIDSLFLPNGVATLGIDSSMTLPEKIKDKNVVFVIDNQPRNRDVVGTLQDLIKKKFNVVLWPTNIKEKDVNDMILAGKTSQQIVDIINQNTYNGLQAQLKLNEWKKI